MADYHTHTEASKIAHYERLMKIKQLQINALLEISQAINNNFPTASLLRIYEFTLKAQLHIPKLAVFVKDSDWDLVCASGVNDTAKKIDVEKDLISFHQLTNVTDQKKLQDFDVVIPVFHNSKPLAYALIGGFDPEEAEDEQLKFIQTLTNVVVVAVENRKLLSAQIEQQLLKKELELAAEVQAMLFPSELPNNDKIEMAAVYSPHDQIGGDYYDCVQISDDEIAFCIGDISGKGMAAALLMSNFQANFRGLVNESDDLTTFAETLNDKVSQITKGERFITFFLGVYNFKTRLLRYFNAGHNAPILLQNNKFIELQDGCTLLGMFEDLPFVNPGEIVLEKDALLTNYTDGVTDIPNDGNEFYGLERLKKFVKKNSKLPLEKLLEKLREEVTEYMGTEGHFIDDFTILACRFF